MNRLTKFIIIDQTESLDNNTFTVITEIKQVQFDLKIVYTIRPNSISIKTIQHINCSTIEIIKLTLCVTVKFYHFQVFKLCFFLSIWIVKIIMNLDYDLDCWS